MMDADKKEQAPAAPSRGRRVGRIVAKVVAIAAICLVCGEITLRVYDRFQPLFIFYSDSFNRFRPKPGTNDYGVPLNSDGFKDVEFGPKTPGVVRVAALGDSFAFGVVPYQSNYLTVLEDEFARRGEEVEVLNLGIPNIGPDDYLDMLAREALPRDPDFVLVSFFVGNDYEESRPKPRRWFQYSHLATLVWYLTKVRPNYEGIYARVDLEYEDDAPTFGKEKYLEIERDRAYICHVGDEKLAKHFPDALDYLTRMAALCRRRGVGFAVVLIPDQLQVDAALRREVIATYFPDRPASAWDWARPNRLLAEALAERGVEVIDLYPVFAREGRERRLYKRRDSHWNIAGNHLAAEAIAEALAPRF